MIIDGTDYTIVTLDAETFYDSDYSLGQTTMNTYKYITDPRFKEHGWGMKIDDQPTVYYRCEEMTTFIQHLKQVRKKYGKPVAMLAHNTAFDGLILAHIHQWVPDLYLDTMSMSRGMFVGYPASLAMLALRLWPKDDTMRKGTELVSTKGIYNLNDEQQAVLGGYCIQDVDLTYAAFLVMEQCYPDLELWVIHLTIRFNCDPWLEADGRLLQDEIDYQQQIETDAFAAAEKAYGISNKQLASNPQFCKVLETLGIEWEMKENNKGQMIPALGQKDWGYLRMMAAHPDHQVLWHARKVSKSNIQLSRARWMKAVGEYWNGLMPVPLNYYGADTGRWSGGEKLNLQNLPRNNNGEVITDPNSGRLRRALRAPKGFAVVVRDLSNIEGRVLAWIAGQQHLLTLFRNGDCPYLYMAAGIYHIPFEQMSKKSHPFERNVGKVAVLGLGYGLGGFGFWVALNTGPMGADPIPCDFDFADGVVKTYRKTNDRIVAYWAQCDQFLSDMYCGRTHQHGPLNIQKNCLIMPNGMALQYPNLNAIEHNNGYDFKFGQTGPNKKIYGGHLCENIVQALARIILTEQMHTVERNLQRDYGLDLARLVHCVHDEMIAVVPEREAEAVYQMMGEVMSTPPSWATDLPLLSEGGWAAEYSK